MTKHDQVTPLNYCAHAIDSMREQVKILRHTAPLTAGVFMRLVTMLQRSVKFILPNGCDLLDPDGMNQAHLDLARLPYPCVAFEAPWLKEDDGIANVGEFQQSPATKRITLCWDTTSGFDPMPGLMASTLENYPDGGIFVLPIFWGTDFGTWIVGMGGTFVPYENTMQFRRLEDEPLASRIAHQVSLEAGLIKPGAAQFLAEPFQLLPEICEATLLSHGGDKDKLFANIMIDSRDEVMVLIQACAVINCANVTTSEVSAASPKLDKKRAEKGNQPFFTYKVLQLSGEQGGSSDAGGGGTHASPRMHLRRAHLRRLANKTVLVRHTMVKAGSTSGVVVKDYAVDPS